MFIEITISIYESYKALTFLWMGKSLRCLEMAFNTTYRKEALIDFRKLFKLFLILQKKLNYVGFVIKRHCILPTSAIYSNTSYYLPLAHKRNCFVFTQFFFNCLSTERDKKPNKQRLRQPATVRNIRMLHECERNASNKYAI